MRLHLLPLTLLAALTPAVFAVPQITSPAAGATLPAGSITVKWTDDGTSQSLSQFESYTLTLFVGGNLVTNARSLVAIGAPTGGPKSGTLTGTVDPTLTASLTNGFYIQMIATAKIGGTYTAYSSRFTLSGMTGPPETAAIRSAVTALGSSSVGPADVNGVAAAAPQVPGAGATAAVPAADPAGFGIPYNQQTGPIRYAPMQGVPPTKITLKNFTPLFPTSAYTIAKTWLPIPTIVSTTTMLQTFSVQSSVNQASPQSQPTPNDMQKFMNRWKD